MTRGLAVLGSAVFFLIAPTTVAGVVPWWISRWRLQAPFFDLQLIRWFGVVLILLGIPVLVDTFTRFALQGGGTPAPVAPTQHLVITGPNRYVRNPIYLALVAIVLGQGLILGNARLLVYGALLWIGFHIFVLAYEEPTLRRRFGAEYDTYCANVSLVATLARLYVGVVLIDRECECRGHRRRIVGVVYDHMCQQQCDQGIGYGGGVTTGQHVPDRGA